MSPLEYCSLLFISQYDSLSICKSSTGAHALMQETSYIWVPLSAATPVSGRGHEAGGAGCSSGWE